jgi:hypothetical protein
MDLRKPRPRKSGMHVPLLSGSVAARSNEDGFDEALKQWRAAETYYSEH